MIRLFKHYVPYAVLFLGLIDFILLLVSAELSWLLRAHQIHMAPGDLGGRLPQLFTFAASLQVAAIAVGVYEAEALKSMRL